jgi:hypothetical protein
MTAAMPSYAAGFTPPGLAKKGGLPPGIAKKFGDLSGFEWAMEAIERLAEKGVLSGVGEGKFAPSNNVTKVEALAMIIRGLGWDDEADLSLELIEEGKIKDKAKDKLQDWTKGYIEVAIEKGLIDEADLTKQSFTTPATRQEVAMYIIRAMGLETKAKEYTKDDLKFDDKAAVKSDAAGYVYLISEKGIMKGYPDGTFRPNQPVKRAEMASLVAILDDLIDDDDDDQDTTLISGKLIWFNTEKVYIEKNGKVEGYALHDAVKIYIDGKQKTLDDLRIDKIVSLKLEGNLVKEIRWNTEVVVIEDTFKGSITDIDRDDKEVVVKNDSKERLFKIENNTVIKIDGRTKSFGDLSIGMKVELKIIDGKVDSISVQTNTETFKGTIKQIYASTEQLKILVGSKERIIQLDDDTDIEIDGRDAGFDKLVTTMKVEVRVENGEVTELHAESIANEYEGTLIEKVEGTQNKLTIKIGSQNKIYVVAEDAEILDDDGDDIDFSELKVGREIEIRVENNIIVKIEMED